MHSPNNTNQRVCTSALPMPSTGGRPERHNGVERAPHKSLMCHAIGTNPKEE